jgi:hypothetical protein
MQPLVKEKVIVLKHLYICACAHFGTQSQKINSILSQMFPNINCPIRTLGLKQIGGGGGRRR